MATSFKGWGSSWLDSWGPITVDPNAMQGSASFSFTASLQVNSGDMQGSASFRIDAILGVGEPRFSQEVELTPRRKWYVKRKNRIHVFDDAQSADSYLEAESVAEAAIQEAQKTSRRSRKRLRERVLKAYALPVETIDTNWLTELVNRFSIPVNLPDLVAQQDWERVMQIQALALDMQEEDDLEMLLLAI